MGEFLNFQPQIRCPNPTHQQQPESLPVTATERQKQRRRICSMLLQWLDEISHDLLPELYSTTPESEAVTIVFSDENVSTDLAQFDGSHKSEESHWEEQYQAPRRLSACQTFAPKTRYQQASYMKHEVDLSTTPPSDEDLTVQESPLRRSGRHRRKPRVPKRHMVTDDADASSVSKDFPISILKRDSQQASPSNDLVQIDHSYSPESESEDLVLENSSFSARQASNNKQTKELNEHSATAFLSSTRPYRNNHSSEHFSDITALSVRLPGESDPLRYLLGSLRYLPALNPPTCYHAPKATPRTDPPLDLHPEYTPRSPPVDKYNQSFGHALEEAYNAMAVLPELQSWKLKTSLSTHMRKIIGFLPPSQHHRFLRNLYNIGLRNHFYTVITKGSIYPFPPKKPLLLPDSHRNRESSSTRNQHALAEPISVNATTKPRYIRFGGVTAVQSQKLKAPPELDLSRSDLRHSKEPEEREVSEGIMEYLDDLNDRSDPLSDRNFNFDPVRIPDAIAESMKQLSIARRTGRTAHPDASIRSGSTSASSKEKPKNQSDNASLSSSNSSSNSSISSQRRSLAFGLDGVSHSWRPRSPKSTHSVSVSSDKAVPSGGSFMDSLRMTPIAKPGESVEQAMERVSRLGRPKKPKLEVTIPQDSHAPMDSSKPPDSSRSRISPANLGTKDDGTTSKGKSKARIEENVTPDQTTHNITPAATSMSSEGNSESKPIPPRSRHSRGNTVNLCQNEADECKLPSPHGKLFVHMSCSSTFHLPFLKTNVILLI